MLKFKPLKKKHMFIHTVIISCNVCFDDIFIGECECGNVMALHKKGLNLNKTINPRIFIINNPFKIELKFGTILYTGSLTKPVFNESTFKILQTTTTFFKTDFEQIHLIKRTNI